MSVWLVAAAIAITAITAPSSRRGPVGHVRGHARRLLGDRWSVHLQGRLLVPVDTDPADRAAARCGAGDGVATGSADARADAPPRPPAGRRCARRAGGVGGAVLVVAHRRRPAGFLLCGAASLLLIAAVTHRRTLAGRLLGAGVLLWIGTRSYGLYLYHWPIYQIIRGVSGRPLSVAEFVARAGDLGGRHGDLLPDHRDAHPPRQLPPGMAPAAAAAAGQCAAGVRRRQRHGGGPRRRRRRQPGHRRGPTERDRGRPAGGQKIGRRSLRRGRADRRPRGAAPSVATDSDDHDDQDHHDHHDRRGTVAGLGRRCTHDNDDGAADDHDDDDHDTGSCAAGGSLPRYPDRAVRAR